MMRVLDLSRRAAGGFATMLLAGLGAEVLRPEGGDEDGQLDEYQRAYLSGGKTVVRLDPASAAGRRALRTLAREVDAAVEDRLPGETDPWRPSYRGLRRLNPGLVLTSITPFGLRGPRAGWKSSELVQQAMGGVVAASGHNEGPPQQLGGAQSAHVAGLHAAIVTLAAIRGVRGGKVGGVHVDVSIQEVMSTHWTREIGRYVYTGEGTGRPSASLGLQGFPHTARAKDGYVFLLPLRAEWETFAHFLGLEHFITEEWSDAETRAKRWGEIEPYFLEALQQRGRYEWLAAGAERGWTLAPIDDPLSVLASPQLEARGFFQPATLTNGTEVPAPGLPFKFFV